MNSNEQRQALGKPYMQKLKDLGMGLSMDRVLGDRVLIMPIVAYTDADRVEKSGLLVIPDTVRDTNTPPPTVGEVVMIGPEVPQNIFYIREVDGIEEKILSYELQPHLGVDLSTYKQVREAIINVGEAVMFSRFAGMDIMLDNVAMKLVHVNEIACVLKAKNPDAVELVEDSRA